VTRCCPVKILDLPLERPIPKRTSSCQSTFACDNIITSSREERKAMKRKRKRKGGGRYLESTACDSIVGGKALVLPSFPQYAPKLGSIRTSMSFGIREKIPRGTRNPALPRMCSSKPDRLSTYYMTVEIFLVEILRSHKFRFYRNLSNHLLKPMNVLMNKQFVEFLQEVLSQNRCACPSEYVLEFKITFSFNLIILFYFF